MVWYGVVWCGVVYYVSGMGVAWRNSDKVSTARNKYDFDPAGMKAVTIAGQGFAVSRTSMQPSMQASVTPDAADEPTMIECLHHRMDLSSK